MVQNSMWMSASVSEGFGSLLYELVVGPGQFQKMLSRRYWQYSIVNSLQGIC